ncbi:MAG: ParB N-terminal domain-containing protein, partial [Oscillospiraceae bacterium]
MAKFDMESLISGGKVSKLDTTGTTVERLPLSQIRPSPHNFYNATTGIGDLAESIQANGLLEPLLVRPDGDNYRIISGHRRYNALCEMAALQAAYDYDAIECIVDRAPMTSAQETVKLIEANRQRVKTSYEVATEAERLTAAYVARKVAGETLPGKVRDMVARDMELSASKLARLKVIKDGLTLPGFVEAFEKDKMPESVAYEIAKLPSDEQYRVLDLSIERGEPVSLDLVKRYNFLKLKKSTCNRCEGDHPCNIGNIQYDHFYRYGNVTGCAGCCKRCTSTDSCSYVC